MWSGFCSITPETTLAAGPDNPLIATSSGCFSIPVLLEFSAGFDIVDHSLSQQLLLAWFPWQPPLLVFKPPLRRLFLPTLINQSFWLNNPWNVRVLRIQYYEAVDLPQINEQTWCLPHQNITSFFFKWYLIHRFWKPYGRGNGQKYSRMTLREKQGWEHSRRKRSGVALWGRWEMPQDCGDGAEKGGEGGREEEDWRL